MKKLIGIIAPANGSWSCQCSGEWKLEHDPDTDAYFWAGWIRAENGQILQPGGTYFITLPDGRQVEILIADDNTSATAIFEGQGPCP